MKFEVFNVYPQFSAWIQTFCLTARAAYLNTQKCGLFCTLHWARGRGNKEKRGQNSILSIHFVFSEAFDSVLREQRALKETVTLNVFLGLVSLKEKKTD